MRVGIFCVCVCKIKLVFSITFFVTWWHNFIYMEWEFYNSAGINKNNIYVFTLLVCENGINFSLTLLSGIRLPLWDPGLTCMAAMAVCSSSVSMWQRQQQRSEATSIGMYSISQEICTRFCCALLCCGCAIVHNEFTWSIYPYSSRLLCWHWGNR